MLARQQADRVILRAERLPAQIVFSARHGISLAV
jgi:hypothetical protein